MQLWKSIKFTNNSSSKFFASTFFSSSILDEIRPYSKIHWINETSKRRNQLFNLLRFLERLICCDLVQSLFSSSMFINMVVIRKKEKMSNVSPKYQKKDFKELLKMICEKKYLYLYFLFPSLLFIINIAQPNNKDCNVSTLRMWWINNNKWL